ncbi:integration host factor, actinobacterial type [Streptosporangium subroseum]|uniref:integration host factor, actinobacterial type n=1 Tax=Streptosporangium subroseum TaxID=106412 RepID=UPI003093CB6E|nr:integration host factor [Streptosporangium subroseum]
MRDDGAVASAGVYGGRACDQPIYLRESSSMALPTMTPERWANALVKSAEARKFRTELLAEVKSGKTSVAEVFGRTGEDIVKRTRVVQVLRAVPGYGPAKVAALMATSGVDEKRGSAG